MVMVFDLRVVKVHGRQGVVDQLGKSKSSLSTASLATCFITCRLGVVDKGKYRSKLFTTSTPTWLGVVDKGESRSWKTCQGDLSFCLSSDLVCSDQQKLEENSRHPPVLVCSLFNIGQY